MLKLSRLATIAPAQKIVDEELARELNRRFGRSAFPIKVAKLGRGVCFAFGMPGRVKATGFTDAERERIEAQMGKTIADLELEANAQFEYWLLATPRSLRNRNPGFEPVATRTDAAAELAEIQVMVDTLHSTKEIATRPMDGPEVVGRADPARGLTARRRSGPVIAQAGTNVTSFASSSCFGQPGQGPDPARGRGRGQLTGRELPPDSRNAGRLPASRSRCRRRPARSRCRRCRRTCRPPRPAR